MAGVYAQGWGYSVVVALGVVLAAMYILRAISAILHVKPGPAVQEEALDLRAGELALVLPLLLVLVGLSFWPALVSESSFAGDHAPAGDREGLPLIQTPTVDWLALAPTIALLVGGGSRSSRRSCPTGCASRPRRQLRSPASPWRPGSRSRCSIAAPPRRRCSTARCRATSSPPWRRSSSASTGAVVVFASWGERRRENHAEYYALLAAAGAGMVFFVGAENLMTLFLGLEWFSLCLYILVAFDSERATSLEAGLKYLIVGGLGSAVLLFGSALVYGATAS